MLKKYLLILALCNATHQCFAQETGWEQHLKTWAESHTFQSWLALGALITIAVHSLFEPNNIANPNYRAVYTEDNEGHKILTIEPTKKHNHKGFFNSILRQ
jgi:hypothetical protein